MTNPTFHHWGNAGDIIYALPSIADLIKRAGSAKAVLYLEIDHPARYPVNMRHPLKNVNLTREYADRLIPLLLAQPYIAEVRIWNGETVDFNLNLFRGCCFDHGRGDVTKFYRHIYPCLPRTWEPWLSVTPDETYDETILINRTQRYHNPQLSYSFLKKYEPQIRFMGLPAEYNEFRAAYGIRVPHFLPKDFLQAARAIAACRLFIGNQSACFAIAEALKVPRIVEVYIYAANVVPCGENGYEVIQQSVFEQIVADLIG